MAATFQTSLCASCTVEPLCCCFGTLLPPCAQCKVRYDVLDGDMSKYSCCQGYFNICCFEAGSVGESSCPHCCLCLEVTLCEVCALNASRSYTMDRYRLQERPNDANIIQCNNCLQLCACVCSLAACVTGDEDCQQAASCVRFIANIVYCILGGCITAQVEHECNVRQHKHRTRGMAGGKGNDFEMGRF